MMKTILKLAAAGAVTGAVLVNLHPGFGRNPNSKERSKFSSLPNTEGKKFVNEKASKMEFNPCDLYSLIRDSLRNRKSRSPDKELLTAHTDWHQDNSITWLGHSAFYMRLEGVTMLMDPMLGPAASPLPFFGSSRYTGSLLYLIEEMPEIDVLLLTHDHYDHLDYPSIMKLKDRVRRFIVPLGAGSHLKRWGVEEEKITELNWLESAEEQGIRLTLTPSRHFSGRGIMNQDQTLWGGWIILSDSARLYVSGDGGYGDHFRRIGEAYGPFDITIMEGGQYDDRWSWVHMMPEEAVQAHQDVRGDKMMLAHWGALTLAYHSWQEPIERALAAAEKDDVELLTPVIGSTLSIHDSLPQPKWWR